MRYHKISFICLFLGFLISALYQYYRSTLNEVPAYDAFGLTEVIVYVGLTGIAGISFINKNWASVFMIGFCIIGYIIALGYYFPVILPQRTIGWIDITESIVYLGCILAAAIFSFMAIRHRKHTKASGV